jgi:L-iditol 2-dehydrogenase
MIGLFKTAPGEGNLAIQETEIPEPAPDEVLIKVEAAGICGSDVHIRHWDINFPMRPPMIIGHEYSGTIEKLGSQVDGWKVGDRVTSETTHSACGKCYYCRTGYENLCPERKTMGYWVNGAFGQYTVKAAKRLHKLPGNVDFIAGAMTEPLACTVLGVIELTKIHAGDVVVVTGPGAIGLMSAQLAKAEGGTVVVIGTGVDEQRLKKAKELGAQYTVNLDKESPNELIQDLTKGYGADVILECSGAAPAVPLGFDLVRKQGSFTQIGLFGKPLTIDFERIAYKELRVIGSLSHRWTTFEKALQLMSEDKVRVKPLVSDVLPLSQWEEGFRKFESKEAQKVIFHPWEEL